MKIPALLIIFFCGIIAYAVISSKRPPVTAPSTLFASYSPAPSPGIGTPALPTTRISPAPEPKPNVTPFPAAAVPPPTPPVSTPTPSLLSSLLSFLHPNRNAPPSTPATPHVTWRREELTIARGTVLERLDGALVIQCEPWHTPVHDITVEDSVLLAPPPKTIEGVAYSQELDQYGPLLTVVNGRLQPSQIDPGIFDYTKYVYGTARVSAVPVTLIGPGKLMRIVVAPEGEIEWHGKVIPLFKATFALEGGSLPNHGEWMWTTRGRTGLDRR